MWENVPYGAVLSHLSPMGKGFNELSRELEACLLCLGRRFLKTKPSARSKALEIVAISYSDGKERKVAELGTACIHRACQSIRNVTVPVDHVWTMYARSWFCNVLDTGVEGNETSKERCWKCSDARSVQRVNMIAKEIFSSDQVIWVPEIAKKSFHEKSVCNPCQGRQDLCQLCICIYQVNLNPLCLSHLIHWIPQPWRNLRQSAKVKKEKQNP